MTLIGVRSLQIACAWAIDECTDYSHSLNRLVDELADQGIDVGPLGSFISRGSAE